VGLPLESPLRCVWLSAEVVDILKAEFHWQLNIIPQNYGKSQIGDMMKISTIIVHIILCLTVLMLISGCSYSNNQVLALFKERQMDDDQRLYGNPYESLNQQNYIQFYVTY
jgi:hypothetical protein